MSDKQICMNTPCTVFLNTVSNSFFFFYEDVMKYNLNMCFYSGCTFSSDFQKTLYDCFIS